MNKVEQHRQKMTDLVLQWQYSGQSQKAFAATNNIKLFTFRYWIQKHREQQQSVGNSFLQLDMPSNTGISIRYANGTTLELPVNTPLNTIKQLLIL